MRLIDFSKEKIVSLKGSPRYIGVIVIFLLAVFYNLRTAGPDAAVTKDEKSPATQAIERVADLDNAIREKVFFGKLDSQSGDYYRIIVRAEANEAERVEMYARTLLGEEKKIGDMDLVDGVESFHELVFAADDLYRDIVIRRTKTENNKENSWDETKIYIGDVSVARLGIRTVAQAERLQPTLFGETKTSVWYLPISSGETGSGFPNERKQIGQYFEADASALRTVHVKFRVIGSGGSGKYEVEVKETDDEDSKKMNTIGKIDFAADKLWKYKEENGGVYIFEMPLSFEKGKAYYVGVNSSDVATDEKNYLQLIPFGEDKGSENSFFALSLVSYTEVSQGKRLLSNAVLQDNGSVYSYDYRMSHTPRDLLDVYSATGKLKFDENLRMLTLPKSKDASLIYKVDMKYPLERMHIRAQMFGLKDEEVLIEYSYDGENWKSALNENMKNISSRETDFYIDGEGDISTIFLRFEYNGKGNNNKIFGVTDLQIAASLRK